LSTKDESVLIDTFTEVGNTRSGLGADSSVLYEGVDSTYHSARTTTAQEGEVRIEGSMRDAVILRQRLGKVGRCDGGGVG
jgi:hypothetical protein